MAKRVKVMRGISGAGKSTMAKKLIAEALSKDERAVICSADDFFMDDSGKYQFNPALLGAAHKSCLRNFLTALQDEVDLVVVDNTNINVEDMAPYVALGEALDYDVEIIQVDTPSSVAMLRNVHGVPPAGVLRMEDALLKTKVPGRFKLIRVTAE